MIENLADRCRLFQILVLNYYNLSSYVLEDCECAILEMLHIKDIYIHKIPK